MFIILIRVCGIISPLIGLALVWIAVNNSPWFRWTEEDLSVLGAEGSGTALFTWGLLLSGFFSLLFVIGLSKGLPLRQPLGYIGIVALILGSVGLALVGLIPRTTPVPHNTGSVAFFTLIPSGLFIIGLSLIMSTQLLWGIFSITSAVLMVVLQLVPWPWQGGSISQILSSLPWAIWLLATAIRLLGIPVNA